MSRILIIEDEDAIAELERDYLALSGFDVVIEHDGLEGLKRADQESFDLYVLDIMLPGMDGFDVCAQIRKKSDAPIIMVSAKKEDIDKIRGLGLGADDYMTKPFSPSELVARVKAHLSRYDRLTSASVLNEDMDTYSIRGIKIDKNAHRVWVNGAEKQLTSKEFELLVFMSEHPNKVFSKEELFKSVWNAENIGDIATVAVHVKRLRQKIEIDSNQPQYIETIWGVGYRFKV